MKDLLTEKLIKYLLSEVFILAFEVVEIIAGL